MGTSHARGLMPEIPYVEYVENTLREINKLDIL